MVPSIYFHFIIHRFSYHKNYMRNCKHYKINHIQNINKTEKIQEEIR